MTTKRLTTVIALGILAGGIISFIPSSSSADSFFTAKAQNNNRHTSGSTIECPHCGHSIRLSASTGSETSGSYNYDYNYSYSAGDRADIPSDNSQKVKTISVNNFTKVTVSRGLPVIYVQGALKPVKIEGKRDIVDAVKVTDDYGTVTISLPSGKNFNTKDLMITLTSPNLTDVQISSGSSFMCSSEIKTSKALNITGKAGSAITLSSLSASTLNAVISGGSALSIGRTNVDTSNLDISGGSGINLTQLKCKTFNCNLSSGSGLTVSGSAKNGNIGISGGSSYNGNQFDMGAGNIDISGGSAANLNGNKLNVDCDKSSIVTGFSSKNSSKIKISK